MARGPRIDRGGIAYHVMNRTSGKRELFEDAGDYEAFERVLAEAEKYALSALTPFPFEENVHNGRIVGYYLNPKLAGGAAGVGQEAARKAEEQLVGQLTEDIFQRGRPAGWW